VAKGTKTGGRQKGTPNKATAQLVDIFSEKGLMVPERLCELLPELEPKDQAKVLTELMQYLYPKRKAVEHSFNAADLDDGELIKEAIAAIEHFKAQDDKGNP
jgi:hypothetical protein